MEPYVRTFSVPLNGISLFIQILKAFQSHQNLIYSAELVYDFERELFMAEIRFFSGEDYILFHNVCVSASPAVKTEQLKLKGEIS